MTWHLESISVSIFYNGVITNTFAFQTHGIHLSPFVHMPKVQQKMQTHDFETLADRTLVRVAGAFAFNFCQRDESVSSPRMGKHSIDVEVATTAFAWVPTTNKTFALSI